MHHRGAQLHRPHRLGGICPDELGGVLVGDERVGEHTGRMPNAAEWGERVTDGRHERARVGGLRHVVTLHAHTVGAALAQLSERGRRHRPAARDEHDGGGGGGGGRGRGGAAAAAVMAAAVIASLGQPGRGDETKPARATGQQLRGRSESLRPADARRCAGR